MAAVSRLRNFAYSLKESATIDGRATRFGPGRGVTVANRKWR
jgi:hypothetical protein